MAGKGQPKTGGRSRGTPNRAKKIVLSKHIEGLEKKYPDFNPMIEYHDIYTTGMIAGQPAEQSTIMAALSRLSDSMVPKLGPVSEVMNEIVERIATLENK